MKNEQSILLNKQLNNNKELGTYRYVIDIQIQSKTFNSTTTQSIFFSQSKINYSVTSEIENYIDLTLKLISEKTNKILGTLSILIPLAINYEAELTVTESFQFESENKINGSYTLYLINTPLLKLKSSNDTSKQKNNSVIQIEGQKKQISKSLQSKLSQITYLEKINKEVSLILNEHGHSLNSKTDKTIDTEIADESPSRISDKNTFSILLMNFQVQNKKIWNGNKNQQKMLKIMMLSQFNMISILMIKIQKQMIRLNKFRIKNSNLQSSKSKTNLYLFNSKSIKIILHHNNNLQSIQNLQETQLQIAQEINQQKQIEIDKLQHALKKVQQQIKINKMNKLKQELSKLKEQNLQNQNQKTKQQTESKQLQQKIDTERAKIGRLLSQLKAKNIQLQEAQVREESFQNIILKLEQIIKQTKNLNENQEEQINLLNNQIKDLQDEKQKQKNDLKEDKQKMNQLKFLISGMKKQRVAYISMHDNQIDYALSEYINSVDDPKKLIELFFRENEVFIQKINYRSKKIAEQGRLFVKIGGGFIGIEEFLFLSLRKKLRKQKRNNNQLQEK